MKRKTTLADWPEHLHVVFAAIGSAMSGRRLQPEMVKSVAQDHGRLIADHVVSVRHMSGEGALPGGNRYEVKIYGPRIIGGWSFRSGELENLARATIGFPPTRQ